MAPHRKYISPEIEQGLRECLFYDKETGDFIWLKTIHSRALMCRYAGTIGKNGYRVIQFRKILFRANRLAIFFETGQWPTGIVDHRNGNKQDDRFNNLRDTNHSENMRNQHKPHKGNKSGFIGVMWHKATGKWVAKLNYNDVVKKHLGLFETPEEASLVYQNAKLEYQRRQKYAENQNT